MPVYLLLSFLLSVSPPAHDFKMSVCEISYLTEREAFEVRFYIFQDDLKEAIYGNPLTPSLDVEKVQSYIIDKVKISVDGHPIPLVYQEIKERKDQVQVIFNSPATKISGFRNLLVVNSLLLEKFKTQTNMVYLTVPGENRLTKILNAATREGLFEF